MANTIRHKRGTSDPAASDFSETAELLVNTADGGLFTKIDDGSVVEVGSVIQDTTPQLGGNLDTNGNQFVSVGTEVVKIDNVIIGMGPGRSFTNTVVGNNAFINRTTGNNNFAGGFRALEQATQADRCVAVGNYSLKENTSGDNNVAIGYQALKANTTATANLAIGAESLFANTTGYNNVSIGHQSCYFRTTGDKSVAVGYQALAYNSTGNNNTAIGEKAHRQSTTASNNTSLGYQAGYATTTGQGNASVGANALRLNTTGQYNTALGYEALYENTTGSGNIGIGYKNASGTDAPVFAPTTEDNRLVMGHTGITNAYVQVAWTVTSDARDKMNFAPVPYGLDFVNQLKPTAYQFKVDRNTETPTGDVRYGFKAQDILALEGKNPVIIDTEDADRFKYKGEHLVPVLVNAVQELTAMVNELKTEVAALKSA